MFCDFKLETDDGKIICGHRVILASASPYFHAMFKKCEEKKSMSCYYETVRFNRLTAAAGKLYLFRGNHCH